MFEKLRSAFETLSNSITLKTLGNNELDRILQDFQLSLLDSDVAFEVVESIQNKLKQDLLGSKVKRTESTISLVKSRLAAVILEILKAPNPPDLQESIRKKRLQGAPFVVLFLGINGTGKTTTISKFAYMLKKNGYSAVVACADTHRAGAIEQMEEHARRLSIKSIAQKYGADPSAVARDAVIHAKTHSIDVVLVDTAGRMQTSRNLMEEMAKISRVTSPDLKIFVGDALAGNDAVSQAKEFAQYTNFHGAILTKADADAKGGSALSIAYATGKPILYLGVGQSYEDLIPFKPEEFVKATLGNA
jgi:fused signal recognition particle receptor